MIVGIVDKYVLEENYSDKVALDSKKWTFLLLRHV